MPAIVAVPELRTDRLRLRGWRPSDVDGWQRICSDPETMRSIGDGTPMPPGRAWHAICYLLGHWALRGYGLWAVEEVDSGALLGRAGLYHPPGWPGLELGWLIDRDRWGEGLATEASRAAADWAFRELEVSSLVSCIRPDNAASIRVAEKLGARWHERTTLDGGEVEVYTLAEGQLAASPPRQLDVS